MDSINGGEMKMRKIAMCFLGVLLFVAPIGCNYPDDSASFDRVAEEDGWRVMVDIDNQTIDIVGGARVINDNSSGGQVSPAWTGVINGHTVEVKNGPNGCSWDGGSSSLTCEVVFTNLDSDECMTSVRTSFNSSTNPSAILVNADYIWPGPTLVPNTTQPINGAGYCITDAGPDAAGSAEGCANTWQSSIPPGSSAAQTFVFTGVPVGQYSFLMDVEASYQACSAPVNMALISAGCFDMGDAFSEGDSDELPVHNVCITSDFYMDVHEVTNSEYAACVSGGGCTAPDDSSSSTRGSYSGNAAYDDFPVIYVDWNQATAYCAWAGKRLPTEAEGEYAARGGLSGKRYPWGDSISGTDANYWDSGDPWDNDTSEVEYYSANGYGLYDMAGNVLEWTNDWYLSNYYGSSPTNNPPGPASGTYRVLRGGYWNLITNYLRVANRGDYNPTIQYYYVGFRCAGD